MHYSVMLNETIDNLNIKPDGIYVDGTVGYAGHSKKILEKLTTGHLYGFDQDIKAINHSNELLSKINNNFTLIHTNFENLVTALEKEGVTKIDGIILDLGFSSPQVDDPTRGFSFMNDGPLDMRMSNGGISAKDIIDTYEEEKLTEIFYRYGEEKLSKPIAKKIVECKNNINTTLELVETIKSAVGANYFYKNHPDRKIFQSIRIEVNRELKVLETVLHDVTKILNSEGRICVISFHSLEDRIVKTIFKEYSEINEMVRGLPVIPEEYKPILKLVFKNPLLPTIKELEENTRSKSAKLRVAERL